MGLCQSDELNAARRAADNHSSRAHLWHYTWAEIDTVIITREALIVCGWPASEIDTELVVMSLKETRDHYERLLARLKDPDWLRYPVSREEVFQENAMCGRSRALYSILQAAQSWSGRSALEGSLYDGIKGEVFEDPLCCVYAGSFPVQTVGCTPTRKRQCIVITCCGPPKKYGEGGVAITLRWQGSAVPETRTVAFSYLPDDAEAVSIVDIKSVEV